MHGILWAAVPACWLIVDVPGAVLHDGVRSNDSATQPVLVLIGSPMGAAGFASLAGHFTDATGWARPTPSPANPTAKAQLTAPERTFGVAQVLVVLAGLASRPVTGCIVAAYKLRPGHVSGADA